MLDLDIPGFGRLALQHLVSDYNGTLARDGLLLPGVGERLARLATQLRIHVITADTFGLARAQLAGLPVDLHITEPEAQDERKLEFVRTLGQSSVVALGNGRNDRKMLKAAALGIALIQSEGGAAETITSADVVSTSVIDALDLLHHPLRLKATLRS